MRRFLRHFPAIAPLAAAFAVVWFFAACSDATRSSGPVSSDVPVSSAVSSSSASEDSDDDWPMPTASHLAWTKIDGTWSRPELYGTTDSCARSSACYHELIRPLVEQLAVEGFPVDCALDYECKNELRESLWRAAPDWSISGIEGFDHGCRLEGEYGCFEHLWNSDVVYDGGECSDEFVRVKMGTHAWFSEIEPGYCDPAKFKCVIHERQEAGYTYGFYGNSDKFCRYYLGKIRDSADVAGYDKVFCQVEKRWTDSTTYELAFDSKDGLQRWDVELITWGMTLNQGECPARYSFVCRESVRQTGVIERVRTKSAAACDRYEEELQSWSEP